MMKTNRHENFGPWSTAIGGEGSANLGGFWRQRLGSLASLDAAQRRISPGRLLGVIVAAGTIAGLPVLRISGEAGAEAGIVLVHDQSDQTGNESSERATIPAAPGRVESSEEGRIQLAQREPVESNGAAPNRDSIEVPARVAGVVTKVLVQRGSRVAKGQVLAVLDDRLARIQLERSKIKASDTSGMQDAIVRQLESEAQRDETKTLVQKGIESAASLRGIEAQVTQAQQSLETARNEQRIAAKELEMSELRLGMYQITSPIDGIVSKLYKDPGEAAEALETVFQIGKGPIDDLDLNEPPTPVDVSIPAQAAGVLTEVLVEAGGKVSKGQVLARIDDRLVRLEWEVAKFEAEDMSKVNDALARLDESQAQLEEFDGSRRARPIEVRVSKAQVELAEQGVEAAKVEQKIAQKDLEEAALSLTLHEIVSPIDGIVTKRLKHPGEAVELYETVFEVREATH